MASRDEIYVASFKYSDAEKKKYIAAGQALEKYRQEINKQNVKQQSDRIKKQNKKNSVKSFWGKIRYGLEYKIQNAEAFLSVVFFMIMEACFVIRKMEVAGLEQVGFVTNAEKIFKISNACGSVGLVIIMLVAIKKIANHDGVLDTIWDLFLEALKALGGWIAIFLLGYGILYFTPEDSSMEKTIEGVSYDPDNDQVEEESVEEAILEEVEQSYAIENSYRQGNHEGDIFTICVEQSYMYSKPDDFMYTYIAPKNFQYVATGSEYLDDKGILWYEFHMGKDKAWVKEEDITFQQ